jgi:ATP-dependent DNA helicase RecQ
MMKWLNKANKVIKKNWNIEALKDKQIEAIDGLMNGNDVIGLLPTGYGKSMCYLIPPLISKMVMLIISPLISLMDDQKDKLTKMGIQCAALHSNNKNRLEEIDMVISGKINIVYMSPEYLVRKTESEEEDEIYTGGIKLAHTLYNNDRLGFLAVDESHCCSVWGQDFRPEYKEIKVFREEFPDIPILAVTATATNKVCTDIAKMLSLDKPILVKASFDRPNLHIKVMIHEKIPTTKKKEILRPKMEYVIPYLKKYSNDKIIIYINNREETEELAQELKGYGALAYHAGFGKAKREDIQNKFASGECKIIISTIAFGMGIDQIVRCIIIFGCPSSIEEYYQQIGRGGRDGILCETILYFNYSKLHIGKFMINKNKLDPKVAAVKRINLDNIGSFAYLKTCRRKFILEYFNEKCNFKTCNNCDNCTGVKTENKTEDIYDKYSKMLNI